MRKIEGLLSGVRSQRGSRVSKLDLGVDFKSRLKGLGSGRFDLGSESNFSGVVCLFSSRFFTLGYFCNYACAFANE